MEATAKHTPGPWSNECPVIVDFDGQQVACVLEDHHNPGVTEADARLIAAAPDLLESLENLLRDLDNRALRRYLSFPVVCAARNVVAQVRGEIAEHTFSD